MRRAYVRAEAWLLEDKHAMHGAALARILSGCSALGLLLTNLRVRDLTFGPASDWAGPAQGRSEFLPPRIVEHLGDTGFLIYYLAVMALAVCWILGWHARVAGVLMLFGMVSIVERNPVLGDQGDNIWRIGVFWLLLMHTTECWSLDSRRRSRTGREPVVPRWASNGLHNIALAALMFQLVLIYVASGMFKVQGALWQHGTALYYPLQLQEFRPFPPLTDAFTRFGVVMGIATYVVVFLQLYFPLLLLWTVTRRLAILLVIVFHVSIAVVMALPWFSLSMIAFDAVFVSSTTFIAADGWVRARLSRRGRPRVAPTAPAR